MTRKIEIISDGRVYEIVDGQPIEIGDTQGQVSLLIQALEFSQAETFEIAPSDAVPRGGGEPRRSTRKIDREGIQLIKAFEGVYLEAYQDPIGIWTIGIGHTNGVRPGMKITEAQVEEFLQSDVEKFEIAVNDAVQVSLDPNQFSALVSFSFNLGPRALFQSTLLKLLNQGDIQAAANEFPRWNKAGGQVFLGLTRRRMAERALFLGKPWQPFLEYDVLRLTQPQMRGKYVRYIQECLSKKGIEIQPDGVFGDSSDRAVKKFQQQKRLTADGVVGLETCKALGL
ncbi:MAG TPA: glycoside hydrolase family protein [Leptolyngbyaceae cyanobacterium]